MTPYIAGGIVTLASGLEGFYLVVVAVLFSYGKAIVDAWVLLIEINR